MTINSFLGKANIHGIPCDGITVPEHLNSLKRFLEKPLTPGLKKEIQSEIFFLSSKTVTEEFGKQWRNTKAHSVPVAALKATFEVVGTFVEGTNVHRACKTAYNLHVHISQFKEQLKSYLDSYIFIGNISTEWQKEIDKPALREIQKHYKEDATPSDLLKQKFQNSAHLANFCSDEELKTIIEELVEELNSIGVPCDCCSFMRNEERVPIFVPMIPGNSSYKAIYDPTIKERISNGIGITEGESSVIGSAMLPKDRNFEFYEVTEFDDPFEF